MSAKQQPPNGAKRKRTPVETTSETDVADNESGINEEKQKAPDPTRYGDWEKNGRCIDF